MVELLLNHITGRMPQAMLLYITSVNSLVHPVGLGGVFGLLPEPDLRYILFVLLSSGQVIQQWWSLGFPSEVGVPL